MKIRCLVVDDEPVALQKMQRYVEKTPYLELAGGCDNAADALKILSESDIDVIFTDIEMVGLSGLDFVSSLSKAPLVVFVTAYHEYAVESYKVGALDYIVKPYGLKEFQRAAERVRIQYELMHKEGADSSSESLFVRSDYKWIHIKSENIRYIQGMSDYLRISLRDDPNPVVTYATFSGVMKLLPKNFIQIHRSWVVNTEMIKEIDRNKVVLDQDTIIPIGNSFKENLSTYLQEMSIGKTGR